jgi:hypothetical protein
MSTVPADGADNTDGEADRQVDATVQLRKEVASWSAERSGASARHAAELSVPVPSQPSLQPQPAKRVKRPAPVPPAANKATAGPKKPFTMSYDGVTEADYITYMIARGTR